MFTSFLQSAVRTHRGIAEAAIRASAQVVVDAAQAGTREGFKGGAFVTDGWTRIGYTFNPTTMQAEVGSPDLHFLYWEVGHQNRFTGSYERDAWLTRAMHGTTRQQEAAAVAAAREAGRAGAMGRLLSVFSRPRGAPGRVTPFTGA